jgi:hypothetical protein
LVGDYILKVYAMKGEHEKFHACGQSIWVKVWIDGRTIFCIGAPGQRIWVEHCPKCEEKLSLEELRVEADWRWESRMSIVKPQI